MFQKDSKFITSKLDELKKSVLTKNQQLTNKVSNGKYYQSNDQYNPQSQKSYAYQRQDQYLGQETEPKSYQNNKFTFYQNDNEDKYKTNEPTKYQKFSNVQQSYKSPQILTAKDSPYQKYQSNQNPIQQKYSQVNNSHIPQGDAFRSYYQNKSFNNNNILGQQDEQKSNLMEKSILESVMKMQERGKRQQGVEKNMEGQLQELSHDNQGLGNEINQLTQTLERERIKLEDMDKYYGDDLRGLKAQEQETIQEFENAEQKLQDTLQTLEFEERRQHELNQDLDAIKRENEMLKTELKRLGTRTSEKILECENNINSVGRMKEFHKDNYLMEKDKLQNSAEFVIEQLKTTFNDRQNKISDQENQIRSEKQKVLHELESLAHELRSFNQNADQRIKSEMGDIIENQENEQREQILAIEDSIRNEDQNIQELNQINQGLLNELKQTEKDFQQKLIQSRNTNARLKEEFGNLEDEHNKLMVKLNAGDKENQTRQNLLESLQRELDEIQQKQEILQKNYEDELETLRIEHEQDINEINHEHESYIDQQQRLMDEIKQEEMKIESVQRQHQERLSELQNKLNNTLNIQINFKLFLFKFLNFVINFEMVQLAKKPKLKIVMKRLKSRSKEKILNKKNVKQKSKKSKAKKTITKRKKSFLKKTPIISNTSLSIIKEEINESDFTFKKYASSSKNSTQNIFKFSNIKSSFSQSNKKQSYLLEKQYKQPLIREFSLQDLAHQNKENLCNFQSQRKNKRLVNKIQCNSDKKINKKKIKIFKQQEVQQRKTNSKQKDNKKQKYTKFINGIKSQNMNHQNQYLQIHSVLNQQLELLKSSKVI